MKKLFGIFFFGIVLTFCANSSLRAGVIDPKLRSSLQHLSPEDEVSVIVTLTDQQNLKQIKDTNKKTRRSRINSALRDKAERTQKSLKEFFKKKSARKIIPFWIFNGMAVTLRADAVDELAGRSDVQRIQLDGIVSQPIFSPAFAGVPGWNLDTIHAPIFWNLGYTGTGVVVASMDTGVDVSHPDLASRWRGGSNSWFDPHGQHSSPFDSSVDGHGTGTMGIMVGGDAGGAPIGVAPGASWIAVKLFDDAGSASYSAIHLGFQWLLDPDGNAETDDAPDVVNNSWGYDEFVDQCFTEFQPDIQALKNAGIAVVFSAGNSGPGASTSVSPANYQESLAVGGVDDTLTVAPSSSRGPSACNDGIVFPLYPELVAPGVNIRTADLTLGGGSPDPYAFVSGTSIAAPHVSGAMALLLSASPQLTVFDLETRLSQYAIDLGPISGPDNDYGNGLLDVAAAYNSFTKYVLAVNATGKGLGSITAYPTGIDCPGDCGGEYIEGTVVTLTAVPAQNSRFAGWSGDCTGKEMTCQVTMDQVKSVLARFSSFAWSLFVPALIEQKNP